MQRDENSAEVTREDLPLNADKKISRCEEYFGGSKFINISFGTLTIVITVALLLQIHYGDYQVVPHGSVATDSVECSEIGTTILKKGGNAVDAAIASTFCLSVIAPHTTGLDAATFSSFNIFMAIYSIYKIRPVGRLYALCYGDYCQHKKKFPSLHISLSLPTSFRDGQILIYNHRTRTHATLVDFSDLPISPYLPRLVLGLAYCHRKYGYLSWEDLIQPSIQYARNGFLVSKMLVQAVHLQKTEQLFPNIGIDSTIKAEKLGETLETIANFTDEQLDSFVADEHSPVDTEAYKFKFKHYNVFVPNVPSVGPMLAIAMHEFEKLNFTGEDLTKTLFYYKLVELMRIVYGDFHLSYTFFEGASTNVAVVDKDDNYVSLVSGLTSLFGSGEMTNSGYFMNGKLNGMRYSRLPIIIVDSTHICGRRIVLGANNIALAVQVVFNLLIGDKNASESIEGPRFHMAPNGAIGLERSHLPFFSIDISRNLQYLSKSQLVINEPLEAINVVEKIGDLLSSHSDSRGGGIASRFR